MIRIVARTDTIPGIISILDEIGVHGMTRLHLVDGDPIITTRKQDLGYADYSWEMVLIVIPDDLMGYAISQINYLLCDESSCYSGLPGSITDYISTTDVEDEFDIV